MVAESGSSLVSKHIGLPHQWQSSPCRSRRAAKILRFLRLPRLLLSLLIAHRARDAHRMAETTQIGSVHEWPGPRQRMRPTRSKIIPPLPCSPDGLRLGLGVPAFSGRAASLRPRTIYVVLAEWHP
jgi:hypothetical protein